jgi:hypothetical protein
MDKGTIARVLAEEVRTNTRLRREMGMEEGVGSGVIHEDGNDGVFIETTEGQTFVFGVDEVRD